MTTKTKEIVLSMLSSDIGHLHTYISMTESYLEREKNADMEYRIRRQNELDEARRKLAEKISARGEITVL